MASSLFDWFWRKTLFLWRYFAPALYWVIGYAINAITWLKGSRGRQEEGQERPGERDHEAAAGGGECVHSVKKTESSEMYGVYEQLIITNKYI